MCRGNKWRLASYLELQGHKTPTLMKELKHKCLFICVKKKILFARLTFWPEKIYTSRKYCLTTDFCLWSKSPWCLCFRGVFSTYLPIYFAHLKHKMRFLLQILGCSYQTNFKTFGSWQTQFTAVLYWIFRRLRVGVPFPPCCRTNILHICHNHHNRWLCKKYQPSVNFLDGYVKETALILHKMCSFTKKCVIYTNSEVCTFTHRV